MTALTTVYRIRQHTARRLKHFQQQQAKHVPTMSPAETATMARKELPALRAAMLPELANLERRLSTRPSLHDAELIAHTSPAVNAWQVVVRLRDGVANMAALLTYRTADGQLQAMHFNLDNLNASEATAHYYPAELLRVALRMSAFDTNLPEAAGRMLLHGYAQPAATRRFSLDLNGPLCGLRELGVAAMPLAPGLIAYRLAH